MIHIPVPGIQRIGVGDIVANAAKKLGFQQTENCGCARRQAWLNRLASIGQNSYKPIAGGSGVLVGRSAYERSNLRSSHRFKRGMSGSSSSNCTVTVNPDYTSVQDAVNAAQNGDVVCVNAGSATWTTTLLNPNARYMTLKGAGIGNTIITDGLTKGGSAATTRVIHWISVTGGLTRITGFTFQGGVNNDSNARGMVGVEGNSDKVRIDNNRFNNTRTPMFKVDGYVRGVADHNIFNYAGLVNTNNGNDVSHESWENIGSFGDKSWNVAETLGTAEAFYLEDNEWQGTSDVCDSSGACFAIDANTGGRLVIRFNTFHDAHFSFHGADSGGRLRGTRQFEVYNNYALYDKGENVTNFTASRAGVGMIFDNTVETDNGSTLQNMVMPVVYRHTEDNNGRWGGWCKTINITSITRSGTVLTVSTSPNTHGVGGATQTSPAFGWTILGANEPEFNGTFVGPQTSVIDSGKAFTATVEDSGATIGTGTITIRSPFDANTDVTGYPCLDQVGRGIGDLMSGSTPALAWPTQILIGNYAWNNTLDGILTNSTLVADVVVADRDQYDSVVGGGAGNGTTGIGRGTRAQMDAIGSPTNGVGFWVTNEGSWRAGFPGVSGRFYKSVNGVWTFYYEPYTYPHPVTLL